MDPKKKVGLATKFLSNRNYLKEVPVEGKRTNKFNFSIGFYDQYAAQIIRSGNCITLLSNDMVINTETFFNTHYFEDLSRYVFWTFNKSFLQTLLRTIPGLDLPTLHRCRELLEENFTPFHLPEQETGDEELWWCQVKNAKLKNDNQFQLMYALDEENRTAILKTLREKVAPPDEKKEQLDQYVSNAVNTEKIPANFLDIIRDMDNGPARTVEFMRRKMAEADFEFDLFCKVDKLPNGKNPYGLNGAIAAMIDFFYQHNYFKKEHSLEDIFKSYAAYSGNSIAKLKTFLSEFRADNSYIKHFQKLKQLKINKLK